jgi:hypothetical protein
MKKNSQEKGRKKIVFFGKIQKSLQKWEHFFWSFWLLLVKCSFFHFVIDLFSSYYKIKNFFLKSAKNQKKYVTFA